MGQQSKISLIVPAYQEEKRIGMTIENLSAYLEANHPGTEVIVVCDGCTDSTAAVARSAFVAPSCTLKVLELSPNAGKGFAVRAGVQEAGGDYIFFTDADLSFAPEVMDLFLPVLLNGADVVIAQRSKAHEYPGLGRRLLAKCSRLLIGNLILPGLRDTQAGYKAFRASVAKYLFARLLTNRFLFDLEILFMAKQKGLRIEKVYVDWQDRPGSTVRLYVDTLRSARDLLLIYARSVTGAYRLKEPLQ